MEENFNETSVLCEQHNRRLNESESCIHNDDFSPYISIMVLAGLAIFTNSFVFSVGVYHKKVPSRFREDLISWLNF